MNIQFTKTEKRVSRILEGAGYGFIFGIISLLLFTVISCQTTGKDSQSLKDPRRYLSSQSQNVSENGLVSIFINLSRSRGPDDP